jgi:hypothetical protein
MEKPEKRKPGRPKGTGKAPGRKYVNWPIRWPPDLLRDFLERVPEGEQALFVRRAVCKELGFPVERAEEE